jgi:hypothetical protein
MWKNQKCCPFSFTVATSTAVHKNIKIVEDAYNLEKIEMFFYGLTDGM